MSGAGIVQTKLSDLSAVKADGDVRKVQTVQSSNGRDFETYMNDNSYKENTDVSKTGVKESKGIDNRIKAAFNKAGSKNIEKETMSDDAMYMSQVMSETTVISDSDVIAGIKEIITEMKAIFPRRIRFRPSRERSMTTFPEHTFFTSPENSTLRISCS